MVFVTKSEFVTIMTAMIIVLYLVTNIINSPNYRLSKYNIIRTVNGQNQSLAILNAILLTERAISKEIVLFMDLRVYPSMELAVVRKDVKAFKDHQDFILGE